MSWECHVHVFGPPERYPLAPGRRYTPALADLDALRRHLTAVEADRVVLVQPTVYGADHACLLDALDRLGEAAVGVALCPDADGELPSHPRIRGLRLDLRGEWSEEGRRRLRRAVSRAISLDLHLELQIDATVIAPLAIELADGEVPVALDHLAGLTIHSDSMAIDALLRLLQRPHAYVKLSALERMRGGLADALPVAAMIAERAPGRLLWGSDWPHTPLHPAGTARLAPQPFRAVDDLAALVAIEAALGPLAMASARGEAPLRLYGRARDTA